MSGISLAAATAQDAVIEPGDRFVVNICELHDELILPAPVASLVASIDTIEDVRGRRWPATPGTRPNRLHVPGLAQQLPQEWEVVWLECAGPRRWRVAVRQASITAQDGVTAVDQRLPVEFDPNDWSRLSNSLRSPATLAEFRLGMRAAQLSTYGGFEKLLCLPLVRDMELLEHQVRTAQTVLQRFRGRAMLCDEVGLGKTIEAGLVLSELCLRGLVRSALILTPPSLVQQWQGELRRKFSLDCTAFDTSGFRTAKRQVWQQFDRVIASMHTAKREPHRSAILARKWDMVIVDEAHHLRNRETQLWRFVSELKRRYLLLLTATPVQNHLDELFSLVTLVEPGLLSTSKQFLARFVDRKDRLKPQNVDELHSLLREVMVRNRRSTVGLEFTRRRARTDGVKLLSRERQLYDEVARFVREKLHAADSRDGTNRMVLMTLQRALGSSSQAAARTLGRFVQRSFLSDNDSRQVVHLAEQAMRLDESAKADRLLELLEEFPEKLVIFTQFRATQEMLCHRLAAAGHDTAVFHGGLSRMQKEAAIERFRGPARLLLCTQSGSEGRNLQFASGVCNFDLPWNPMKIEQRIGRLSRIGQPRDVYVFNLVAEETVEAVVLQLLETKLSMFELVIGEIDMILGNLDDEKPFQDVVADLWTESASQHEFILRMEGLGNRLLAAKAAYFAQRRHDDELFGNRFAAAA